MKERIPIEPGRIVVSRAGRDKGTAYVVLELPAEDRALVANGSSRTLDRPKKKNVRHLSAKPAVIASLTVNGQEQKRLDDQALRKGLDAAGYSVT